MIKTLDMFGEPVKACYNCGSPYVQIHHIFGAANRKISEEYGLTVYLCANCHTGNDGVHFNKEFMDRMHKLGQQEFEKKYSREKFMELIGRNYLDE